jgi:hypothetical protein
MRAVLVRLTAAKNAGSEPIRLPHTLIARGSAPSDR